MPSAQSEAMLIAGGGIGGLATALALARRGRPSIILERRSEFSESGAGIQLGPNGVRVLRQLGVDGHLASAAAEPDALRACRGADGLPLSLMPLGRAIEARHGAPYWVAHRADLQKALLAAVAAEPLIAIRTGWDVTSVAQSSTGVAVSSRSGDRIEGPGLVAADGVWSALRRDVLLAPPLPASRHTAARTVLDIGDVPARFRANEVGLWLAPSAHVVHYPVRAGRQVAVVVVVRDSWNGADWSSPAQVEEILAHTQAFAPELRHFLALSTHWRKWSLYEVPPLDQWSDRRVTLLGDAAHPPLPFLAQGGVMALEDAVTLADAVTTSREGVPAAFAGYERRRKPRIARLLAASAENGRIYHYAGMMSRLRDLAMRVVPPQRLLARYDWLYGWRPPQVEAPREITG